MDPTDQFRLLLEQGRSAEVEKLAVGEAKRVLSESPSWSDYFGRNDQALIDELETLKDT